MSAKGNTIGRRETRKNKTEEEWWAGGYKTFTPNSWLYTVDFFSHFYFPGLQGMSLLLCHLERHPYRPASHGHAIQPRPAYVERIGARQHTLDSKLFCLVNICRHSSSGYTRLKQKEEKKKRKVDSVTRDLRWWYLIWKDATSGPCWSADRAATSHTCSSLPKKNLYIPPFLLLLFAEEKKGG